MTARTPKITFDASARRLDVHGSKADCKDAPITLDTDRAGRRDAINPAELLWAALSACMLKSIERVTPLLKFGLRGAWVRVHGASQDVPHKMESIRYEIVVDTDEPEQRLNLLHDKVKKYGTVFNAAAPGTDPAGTTRRKLAPAAQKADASGDLL